MFSQYNVFGSNLYTGFKTDRVYNCVAADPLFTVSAFNNWGVNLPGLQESQKLDTERDFMAMNKAALSAGLVTAPEHGR